MDERDGHSPLVVIESSTGNIDALSAVLGNAESASHLADYFTPVHSQPTVYRRHGDHMLLSAVQRSDSPLPRRLDVSRATSSYVEGSQHQPEPQRPHKLTGSFLLRLPIAMAMVDRHHDIADTIFPMRLPLADEAPQTT